MNIYLYKYKCIYKLIFLDRLPLRRASSSRRTSVVDKIVTKQRIPLILIESTNNHLHWMESSHKKMEKTHERFKDVKPMKIQYEFHWTIKPIKSASQCIIRSFKSLIDLYKVTRSKISHIRPQQWRKIFCWNNSSLLIVPIVTLTQTVVVLTFFSVERTAH